MLPEPTNSACSAPTQASNPDKPAITISSWHSGESEVVASTAMSANVMLNRVAAFPRRRR